MALAIMTPHTSCTVKIRALQVAMQLYRCGLLANANAYLQCLALIESVRCEMSRFPRYLGFYFFVPRPVDD